MGALAGRRTQGIARCVNAHPTNLVGNRKNGVFSSCASASISALCARRDGKEQEYESCALKARLMGAGRTATGRPFTSWAVR